jgi:hypothetical protein
VETLRASNPVSWFRWHLSKDAAPTPASREPRIGLQLQLVRRDCADDAGGSPATLGTPLAMVGPTCAVTIVTFLVDADPGSVHSSVKPHRVTRRRLGLPTTVDRSITPVYLGGNS